MATAISQEGQRHTWYWIIGGLLLLCAFSIRIASYPIVTSDYTYFLSKWFSSLSTTHGLSALTPNFSDYAPLYLYILKLLTFIPVPSLYSIKTVSVLFDILIALFAALLIYKTTRPSPSWARLACIAGIVFITPTIVINGSMWGQADVVFSTFIVLSLLLVLRDRPLWATLSFAVALCFKLQAIFFFPILLGYLLRHQEDIAYLALIPLTYIASIVPAWIGGGSFWYWLTVYGRQSTEYTGLSISAPSVYAFVMPLLLSALQQSMLFYTGLLLGIVLAIAGTVYMARAGRSLPSRILLLSALCATALPYFLPRMHERYFFLADVLSVIYALYRPQHWFIPVLVVGASLLSYIPYLSQLPVLSSVHIDMRIPALMLLIATVSMSVIFYGTPENSEKLN